MLLGSVWESVTPLCMDYKMMNTKLHKGKSNLDQLCMGLGSIMHGQPIEIGFETNCVEIIKT